jgi:hypothetical protein
LRTKDFLARKFKILGFSYSPNVKAQPREQSERRTGAQR